MKLSKFMEQMAPLAKKWPDAEVIIIDGELMLARTDKIIMAQSSTQSLDRLTPCVPVFSLDVYQANH